ncbi:MAG: hypothetical protein KGL39_51930, partial [Patescibacteria group bacterium]|nr:hypothetical protein [Patescibacteria group bacterium]
MTTSLADELHALRDRIPATTLFFREREILNRAASRLTVDEAMVERVSRAWCKLHGGDPDAINPFSEYPDWVGYSEDVRFILTT